MEFRLSVTGGKKAATPSSGEQLLLEQHRSFEFIDLPKKRHTARGLATGLIPIIPETGKVLESRRLASAVTLIRSLVLNKDYLQSSRGRI